MFAENFGLSFREFILLGPPPKLPFRGVLCVFYHYHKLMYCYCILLFFIFRTYKQTRRLYGPHVGLLDTSYQEL